MRVDTGRLRVVAAEAVQTTEPARPSGKTKPRAERAGPQAIEADGADPRSSEVHGSPGAYIRAQRKRRELSLDQLSASTKIPRRQLEMLEADRFEELPGMVFTKGFLRCCARALELDPDTVLNLLYEREREQLLARRRESAAAKTTAPGSTSAAPRRRPRPRRGRVQAWAAQHLSQLPSARILMWLIVALLVAIVVLIAFTLASSQAETLMIRS